MAGGTGGFVLIPDVIGADAGRLVLRILHGELVSNIAPVVGDAVKPIFNWRQMQRWKVDESDLPLNSEIRFRDPTVWERYQWQIRSILAVILIQAAPDGLA